MVAPLIFVTAASFGGLMGGDALIIPLGWNTGSATLAK